MTREQYDRIIRDNRIILRKFKSMPSWRPLVPAVEERIKSLEAKRDALPPRP